MRATFSYASILHAVGQVLDQVSVKSIAIHEGKEHSIDSSLTQDVNWLALPANGSQRAKRSKRRR